MQAHEFINNHHLVTEVFGRWPNFHDGEVHRLVLDRMRQLPNGSYYPSVELLVHGWSMTSEVTASGHYKLEHHSLVHFLFEQVTELRLDGLNHQNVLSSLDFTLSRGKEHECSILVVELGHCHGLSGSFHASRASVVSVVPYVDKAG